MRIGVLGGGQLGRMLALAGYPLGFSFRFLDPSPEAPAGRVGELQVGEYGDLAALERFARGLDAVTIEFENVPASAVKWLEERVPVFPGSAALETGQDRVWEKTLFRRVGAEVQAFQPASTREEFEEAVRGVGVPVMAKTRRFGYDGKGQRVLRHGREVEVAWAELRGSPLIVESLVEFEREVSILGVRSRTGETKFYPIVENRHEGGILRRSESPVDGGELLQHQAERAAGAILTELGYVGVLAVEFFVVGRGEASRLIVNEMAPRVHNSGHWTIEGAETSQFENHLRAGLGLPLGSCAARGRSVMLNLIGSVPRLSELLAIRGAGAGVHVHVYGKEPRPGRKVGHVTMVGRVEEVEERVRALVGG